MEGSTRLLTELGVQRYRTLLDDHRRLMRTCVAEADGFEVDNQGDAFFVAFHRAEDAVRAAVAAQRALGAHEWPAGRAVRVRMGIHTAEATATEEGYVGLGLHHGARICAAGHGGQVLASAATAAILGEADLPFGLVDLGIHRLKDLGQPELREFAPERIAERPDVDAVREQLGAVAS